MGASESTLSTSKSVDDEITTVSHRLDTADPSIEKLKSLKVATPILISEQADSSSLTDFLVRKSLSSPDSGTIDPNVLLELFSIYRDWQEKKTQQISNRQEELENKIEVVDALATKLIQRFNYSVSAMKTTSSHLSEVHGLQVEVGVLKGRLTEVIANCDALCKRIISEGPESLRSSIKPFSASSPVVETSNKLLTSGEATEESQS